MLKNNYILHFGFSWFLSSISLFVLLRPFCVPSAPLFSLHLQRLPFQTLISLQTLTLNSPGDWNRQGDDVISQWFLGFRWNFSPCSFLGRRACIWRIHSRGRRLCFGTCRRRSPRRRLWTRSMLGLPADINGPHSALGRPG